MPRIVIEPCADAAVLAAFHEATVSVAHRGLLPGHPPPTRADLVEVWTGRLAWRARWPWRPGWMASQRGLLWPIRTRQRATGNSPGCMYSRPTGGLRIGGALHDAH